MKKLLIALSAVFIMSGCDTNTESLTCSNSVTGTNGLTTKTTYDIEYTGDDVKYVTITYNYSQDATRDGMDGVNSDTDGLDETNTDNGLDSDDVIDGVVGDAIDGIVQGVTGTILDIAGIKTAYENSLTAYDNIEGLTYKVDANSNTEYKITYTIDMNKISDTDLSQFGANITRDFSDIRRNYEDLGYTCK